MRLEECTSLLLDDFNFGIKHLQDVGLNLLNIVFKQTKLQDVFLKFIEKIYSREHPSQFRTLKKLLVICIIFYRKCYLLNCIYLKKLV